LLSKKQFAKRIGKSQRHVDRLIERGEGPPTVQTGERAIGILEEDARAWIKARRKAPPGWDDGLVNFPKQDRAHPGSGKVRPRVRAPPPHPPRSAQRRSARPP
jgi:predicted DNA-binding transcriptional regulator AlpA